ncbi:MAG TPA: hypothetical protein VKD69_10930, partial [Vicinamibacterales bacterium]|nr:hypothetical protein [Vicinamibacterales bacterium]
MRSPAFRFTIGVAAWIALGVAAFLLVTTEQRISALAVSSRSFDQHAREAIDALAEVRGAQEAYVAAGQGIGFWMKKLATSSESAGTTLAALRSSAGSDAAAPLEQAEESAKEFANIEGRVREYLKSGQQLM